MYEFPLDYAATGYVRPASMQDDPFQLDRPASFARKFIEFVFYLNLVNSSFFSLKFGSELPYVTGGSIILGAIVCLCVQQFQRERLPISIWFIIAMLAAANISQIQYGEVPLMGDGARWMCTWLGQFIMVFYIVQNTAARKRMLFFFTILVAVAVQSSAIMLGSRMALNKYQGPAWLANPNDLAHSAGLIGVALLFISLRARAWARPLYWCAGGFMIMCVLWTVSRGGILSLGCGLVLLLAAVLAGRGARVGGIIFLLVALLAVSQLAYMFTDTWSTFERRMDEDSVRTKVYAYETLYDLWDTIILGDGPSALTTSGGIQAHNSYVVTHMAFGGICGAPYLIWLGYLSLRLMKILRARDYSVVTKLELLALFGMSFAAQLLSNQAYSFLSTGYAFGLIEHFTEPYSRRSQRERRSTDAMVPSSSEEWLAASSGR